jgi:sugar lactone lactonase YvrE
MMINRRLVLAAATTLALTVLAGPAQASADTGYDLPEAGVYLEGIGVDERAGYLYVSATNRDGTIYRGKVGSGELSVWVGPRSGDNGRGIAVDGAGRVYVAGGPSGEVRVFGRDGTLLAELASGAANSFLNDVWIGPDGAAYVTDSSLPVLWRVSRDDGSWRIENWLDVSSAITYTAPLDDFDLGGIVSTSDRRYLLVSQGTTGQLWRIDLASKRIREVALPGGPIRTADGLALRGRTLVVVQNFARQVTTLKLDRRSTTAQLVAVTPTPADRTLTTADFACGQLLVVDSQFGFPPPPAEDRVIPIDTR